MGVSVVAGDTSDGVVAAVELPSGAAVEAADVTPSVVCSSVSSVGATVVTFFLASTPTLVRTSGTVVGVTDVVVPVSALGVLEASVAEGTVLSVSASTPVVRSVASGDGDVVGFASVVAASSEGVAGAVVTSWDNDAVVTSVASLSAVVIFSDAIVDGVVTSSVAFVRAGVVMATVVASCIGGVPAGVVSPSGGSVDEAAVGDGAGGCVVFSSGSL